MLVDVAVGFGVARALAGVDGQEDPVDAAGYHLDQVALQFGVVDTRVELGGGVMRAEDVDVGVDGQQGLVDSARVPEKCVVRNGRIGGGSRGRNLIGHSAEGSVCR